MKIDEYRNWLATVFRRDLELTINMNVNKLYYWLLIRAEQIGPKKTHTRFVLSRYEPPRMLDSMCYFVDNRIGMLERLWVNPADIPIPDWLLDFEAKYCKHPEIEDIDKDVEESAEGMPIIYS